MRRELGIAGTALALSFFGCATAGRPGGSPLHGVAAATVRASGAGGGMASGGGLSLDLLLEKWIASFRSDTRVLTGELEADGARTTSVTAWELAAGPKVFESPGFRLDGFAGARARAWRASDSLVRLSSADKEREIWVDPIAGLRAEWDLGESLSLRVRGDAALGNSGSDHAWGASAAAILTVSRTVSLSLGWEMSSVHYERGSGTGRFLYDADLSGPFLAVELGF